MTNRIEDGHDQLSPAWTTERGPVRKLENRPKPEIGGDRAWVFSTFVWKPRLSDAPNRTKTSIFLPTAVNGTARITSPVALDTKPASAAQGCAVRPKTAAVYKDQGAAGSLQISLQSERHSATKHT